MQKRRRFSSSDVPEPELLQKLLQTSDLDALRESLETYEDGIRDLITDLVGVTLSDGLAIIGNAEKEEARSAKRNARWNK